MKVWARYFLLQVPGWVLAAIALGALHYWDVLSLWIAVGLWLVYVAKDFALYPYLRRGYESDGKNGAETLIGHLGVVRQPLEPEGYIQVHGELWRARAEPEGKAIPAGARVRVVAASGLTLFVRHDPGSAEQTTGVENAS